MLLSRVKEERSLPVLIQKSIDKPVCSHSKITATKVGPRELYARAKTMQAFKRSVTCGQARYLYPPGWHMEASKVGTRHKLGEKIMVLKGW